MAQPNVSLLEKRERTKASQPHRERFLCRGASPLAAPIPYAAPAPEPYVEVKPLPLAGGGGGGGGKSTSSSMGTPAAGGGGGGGGRSTSSSRPPIGGGGGGGGWSRVSSSYPSSSRSAPASAASNIDTLDAPVPHSAAAPSAALVGDAAGDGADACATGAAAGAGAEARAGESVLRLRLPLVSPRPDPAAWADLREGSRVGAMMGNRAGAAGS